jgi:hypothetical protein
MITMQELEQRVKAKKSMTAMELDALLQSCPEWVAQNAEREAKRQAKELGFRAEEEPMIADLAEIGFEVGSVWDLVNTNKSYPTAIPILLDHLRRPYHERIRNGIIRALTVKEAKGIVGDIILDELHRETDEENRWALANALTVVADHANRQVIQTLLDDPAYEDVCERLTEALKQAR